MRALSSVWTECLASDQVAAGSNPAVPITFCDGQHFADGSDPLIKDTPIGQVDFITLCDWSRRHHAIRYDLDGSLLT